MTRLKKSLLPLAIAAWGCTGPGSAQPDGGAGPATGDAPVRVFAAASTTEALQAVFSAHAAAGGARADAVVASSSTLARQIEQGAPADLFLSANPRWMDHLQAGGFIGEETRRDLLGNQLVVVAPKQSAAPLSLDSAAAIVGRLEGSRLAVGDPDHVPAGLYAQAGLRALGLWELLEPHLARSADVRAALALVERGEAPLGIVYATDAAASSAVEVVAIFPDGTHPPVTYPLAIVMGRGENPGVQALWQYLQSSAAHEIFADYGFRRP